MEFQLSDEQRAIFDIAREFGRDRIGPHALEWDRAGTIPKSLWRELGELGFGAMFAPESMGGTGLSRLDGTLVFEGLSDACPSVASFLSIHNMCAWMVATYGSSALRDRYLGGLASMDRIASYCLSEPGSGSDAAALNTRAVRTNDGYALTGSKAFISGGSYSDLYVVMCRTGGVGPKGISSFVVESGTPGLGFGALEDKLGWRAQPTTQVNLEDARVPFDNLLGDEGEGFTYAMAGLDGGRLNIAACALGAAQGAFDKTLTYMAERKAFGKSLNQFQALQFRLADAETELQAGRVFLRQAAWKLDKGDPDATMHCAMAKRFVTDLAFRVANDCLQLHGGYGYLSDYGIEKIVRDLRVHQILEGTNEIMRLIVSRALIGRDRP
ncbi:MAG: acyl-CoA dehydrogenase family protein [Rhodobacteraceae bacterium]|nr:acyl-CoA dehydrogenase family protein [Paracoccaceae bacterium]MCY4141848.1 acyl-CoA dehydrogenase family protein [Paracoccaceae bacterium]